MLDHNFHFCPINQDWYCFLCGSPKDLVEEDEECPGWIHETDDWGF